MTKIALLSCYQVIGFFEPQHPDARPHFMGEKAGSAGDLSHFELDFECLTKALRHKNIQYEFQVWNKPEVDWAQYDAVLIHTPWDYYLHIESFLKTMKKIAAETVLLNSFNTVLWNSNKKYLQEFKAAGISVIDTEFVETQNKDNIRTVLDQKNWDKGLIFKPTVSAGGLDVYHVKSPEEAQKIYEDHFKSKHQTMMIQPFMEEIVKEGEWSFVFLNGQYSHGVLKKTLPGGIGVKHSTENQKFMPTDIMISDAVKMFEKICLLHHEVPLYSRIDVIKNADGHLLMMENEQIEPFLYLHARSLRAADQLISGLETRILFK